MISKEEFRQKCSHLIDESDVASFKKKRQARTIALSVALPVEGFIALVVAIILHNIFSTIVFPVFAFVSIITFVIIYLTTRYDLDDYKEKYLYGILALLLDGYKYNYNHSGFIAPDIYKKSPYIAYYERYHGEDLIDINIPNDDGSPSDVRLHLSDLYLTKTERDSDGDSHTVTVFSGCFGYIVFPFYFKCSLGINHYLRNGEKIKLEDIAFNKSFNIYTDNDLEAYVILTPKMIEKLKKFQKTSGYFSLIILGDRMFFHLNKNIFEMKNLKEGLDTRIFDDIYDDVNTIISIVEEIKNNNKVFKM